MTRPDHLPEFTNPPLNEVVLGVQFAPVPGYKPVHAAKIWGLFEREFPEVQEKSLLDSQYETFGGANVQSGPKISFGEPPLGSRLWFLSKDGNNLLQFQPNRFIANWRKQAENSPPYPRFEGIAEGFENNLAKLASHFAADFGYDLDIDQAKITYVNIIPVDHFSEIGEWLRILNGCLFDIEGVNAGFSEVIKDGADTPFARLRHEIDSIYSADGKHKAFRLNLAFMGKPAGNNIASAMAFLAAGRQAIVTRFCDITTEKAHKFWEKQK
ncbi:hypothetical protein JCM17846_18650 [Iodidimonas nitroreducens]|uniref:TIGR04255 family protein n=1 Tax=Iodidimonas nitroreducens TaxID=1236968 RepID=A0A5A7N780_9PROT|nr:TIGR04255 family protein [Iodidimonas nitroreducens]GAK33238.1 hypothetical protein AQ1_01125 [alpha proteobacterium Q-1]GER04183.1 hypothetical protein JCM17846_18650 [Iodidimonas nitroreducens]